MEQCDIFLMIANVFKIIWVAWQRFTKEQKNSDKL